MSDSEDAGKGGFKPFDDKQRREIEERIKKMAEARQQKSEPDDSKPVASATHLQSAEPPPSETPPAAAPAKSKPDPDPHLEPLGHDKGFHPIDEDQRANIEKLVAEKLKKKQRLEGLRKHLLSMAGKQVRMDEESPFNKLVLEKGQTWNSFDVNLLASPEMTTYRSVARLWENSPDFYKIAVGYALDAAGTWRSHAWLVARGAVNEVAMKYAVYYGVPLNPGESKRFLEWVESSGR